VHENFQASVELEGKIARRIDEEEGSCQHERPLYLPPASPTPVHPRQRYGAASTSHDVDSIERGLQEKSDEN